MRPVPVSWTPLFRTRLSQTPRYLEQNRISLGFAPVFSVIYYELSRTRLSRTPRYLELFLAPLSSDQSRLSRTLLWSKEPWSTLVRKSAVKAPPDKMYWTLRNVWHIHGNESKVGVTGLTTANAEGDKMPVFVIKLLEVWSMWEQCSVDTVIWHNYMR